MALTLANVPVASATELMAARGCFRIRTFLSTADRTRHGASEWVS